MASAAESIKEKAHALIDDLPEDATWADLTEMLAVFADIEAGLAESDANQGVDVATVRKHFGLPA